MFSELNSSIPHLDSFWKKSKIVTNNALSQVGLRIEKVNKHYSIRKLPRRPGKNVFKDIQYLLKKKPQSVIFDVGANVGDTAQQFLKFFPQAKLHCFEPNPRAFASLTQKLVNQKNATLNNLGLGAVSGQADYYDIDISASGSFLKPDHLSWGNSLGIRKLPVVTLDDYCQQNNIGQIDVLKSDTQGFELEVLRGAQNQLRQKTIKMIYLEIIFSKMYHELPAPGKILSFLSEYGFSVAAVYKVHYERGKASWTDMLFTLD